MNCVRDKAAANRESYRREAVLSLSKREQYETEAFRQEPENKKGVADEGSCVSEGTKERKVSGAERGLEMDLD